MELYVNCIKLFGTVDKMLATMFCKYAEKNTLYIFF